ncbi:kinase-like domain-containing protein [Gymnopilus junonius]|uniref:Kinase-like domain-containing protein n=1 Tax=Gymnopilus junonius TaxID=109634 RepID=A0A9P5TK20_GYMJU|nr:kinase-like domain-containing protein [Gymnopilus junonius]
MDLYRWFFGLPDPNEEASFDNTFDRLIARGRRRNRSPYWKLLRWSEYIWRTIHFKFTNMRDYIWRSTLGRWIYVKVGRMATEAATMRFLSSHTSIPIPRVWITFGWGGYHYIFMERLQGAVLEDVWDRLSEDLRGAVANQIKGYVTQLRALPPPPGLKSICSIQGGPVWCFRLNFDGKTGPFRDEEHMNLQLRHLKSLQDFTPIVQTVHARKHPLVFTHNDLFPRNIMIEEKTGKIIAILDWESAGWFPDYWEYCKCINWGAWRVEQKYWKDWVPRMIPVYAEEAEADRVLLWESGFRDLSPFQHAP